LQPGYIQQAKRDVLLRQRRAPLANRLSIIYERRIYLGAVVFFVTLCAYFIKGLTGFANTLIFSSVLSFQMANSVITPMDLILSFPSNIFLVWKERKHISAKVVVPLSLLLLAGLIPGALFLSVADQRQLKIVLGLAIIVLGVEMLLRQYKAAKMKQSKVLLSFIGILSGFLCGLFGVGAFLVAYISRTTENQNQFQGNICCVFLVENVFRIILYTITGILTWDIVKATLMIMPAMIIGMLAGVAALKHVKEKNIKTLIIILLLITGVSLIMKNVL
jgi:uncharacterized membrane protein YfcA